VQGPEVGESLGHWMEEIHWAADKMERLLGGKKINNWAHG